MSFSLGYFFIKLLFVLGIVFNLSSCKSSSSEVDAEAFQDFDNETDSGTPYGNSDDDNEGTFDDERGGSNQSIVEMQVALANDPSVHEVLAYDLVAGDFLSLVVMLEATNRNTGRRETQVRLYQKFGQNSGQNDVGDAGAGRSASGRILIDSISGPAVSENFSLNRFYSHFRGFETASSNGSDIDIFYLDSNDRIVGRAARDGHVLKVLAVNCDGMQVTQVMGGEGYHVTCIDDDYWTPRIVFYELDPRLRIMDSRIIETRAGVYGVDSMHIESVQIEEDIVLAYKWKSYGEDSELVLQRRMNGSWLAPEVIYYNVNEFSYFRISVSSNRQVVSLCHQGAFNDAVVSHVDWTSIIPQIERSFFYYIAGSEGCLLENDSPVILQRQVYESDLIRASSTQAAWQGFRSVELFNKNLTVKRIEI